MIDDKPLSQTRTWCTGTGSACSRARWTWLESPLRTCTGGSCRSKRRLLFINIIIFSHHCRSANRFRFISHYLSFANRYRLFVAHYYGTIKPLHCSIGASRNLPFQNYWGQFSFTAWSSAVARHLISILFIIHQDTHLHTNIDHGTLQHQHQHPPTQI